MLTQEILDLPSPPELQSRKSLRDLERINRFLGGRRVLLGLLREQLRRTRLGSFSFLDVGTGSGDLPRAVARYYPRARVVALDRQVRYLHLASQRGLPVVCGDARMLPFAPGSFDFVGASLFLHHFDDDTAARLVRAFAAVARRAVLINDLHRHSLPYHFIRMAPYFASSPITRHDGPASVQQAFRPAELDDLARRAGMKRWHVHRHLPYRLSLVVEVS